MTAPLDAYVSVVARDCCREIQKRFPGSESAIVCGRHDNYLVIVARGDVAKALEEMLNEKLSKPDAGGAS